MEEFGELKELGMERILELSDGVKSLPSLLLHLYNIVNYIFVHFAKERGKSI